MEKQKTVSPAKGERAKQTHISIWVPSVWELNPWYSYMEYNGDLFRHYIRNYRYEVGMKFDDCATKFVETLKKYNPEIIKYRSFMTKYTPRRHDAPPRHVFSHLWSIFDHFGIVFRRIADKFRITIVKVRTNFVPMFEKRMTGKVPMIFRGPIFGFIDLRALQSSRICPALCSTKPQNGDLRRWLQNRVILEHL